MIKTRKIPVQNYRYERQDVVCDLCGKSCSIQIADDPECVNFSYATLTADFPYGSTKDMEHHELHICEDCYDTLPFQDKIRRNEPFMGWFRLVNGERVFEDAEVQALYDQASLIEEEQEVGCCDGNCTICQSCADHVTEGEEMNNEQADCKSCTG